MAADPPIPPAGERTLQHLLRERAVTHGDRPFATLGGTTHSYAEILDLAARRALTSERSDEPGTCQGGVYTSADACA